jgi:dTDP-4-dehydrorhamnose 3,5-epimerase
MRLISRPLPGMMVLEAVPHRDERGSFQRCFCRDELAELGISPDITQANLSYSERAGTLRGLHYQLGPSAESKLVTCLAGGVHDVVLDLRPGSPTYGCHAAVELTPANRRIVLVPEGCAHGFLSIADQTSMLYLVTAPFDPVRERGVRWNDPAFSISWPGVPQVISPRDAALPDFDPGFHLAA